MTNPPLGQSPQQVAGWGFVINNSNLDGLLQSPAKFLVVDYSRDGSEAQRYLSSDLDALHQGGKTAVAYLSIGEAEEYRYYYQSFWETNPPPWMGRDNPDWAGNTKVQFWDPAWQQIVYGYLDKIIASGFDGIYLDIVDGYYYWSQPDNGEAVVLDQADAAQRMMDFIEGLAAYARIQSGKPDFYVIPQNGEELLRYDSDGSFLKTISAVGVEDLFFDETSAQSAASIAYRTQYLDRVLAAGKPVLVVDYVNDGSGYQGDNQLRIDSFWQQSIQAGYTPQVSSLDRSLATYDTLNATLAGLGGNGSSSSPPAAAAPPVETPIAPVETGVQPVTSETPIAPVVTPTPSPPDPSPLSINGALYGSGERILSGSNSDFIQASNGNDYIAGNWGSDTIQAGAGNDIVYGEWDSDSIEGGDGNDWLWGNDGSDTLIGGEGDDWLTGDRGNDLLSGGRGRDVFSYENFSPATLGTDIITDFEVGVDKFELHQSVFTPLIIGDGLAAGQFAVVEGREAAMASAAVIVFDRAASQLIYNANGTAAGWGDQGGVVAILDNRPLLSASDFRVR